MASATPTAPAEATPPRQPLAPVAGLLSYLVPGLGQIYQGRVGKGLLFMVCIYGLFFYGMALGQWSNVYLPDMQEEARRRGVGVNNPWNLPAVLNNLYNRPQYAGQFWIGVAAWPAIWQYKRLPVPGEEAHPFWHYFQRTPPEEKAGAGDWNGPALNDLQRQGDKTWDLAWVYTVIAGVLNILVIYDALAGPALSIVAAEQSKPKPKPEVAPA